MDFLSYRQPPVSSKPKSCPIDPNQIKMMKYIIPIVAMFSSAMAQDVKTDYPMIKGAFNKVIFSANEGGSKNFRIPAIATAMNGDLVATIDARYGGGDMQYNKKVQIAFKRSADNGKTWTDMELMTTFPKGEVGSDPSLIVNKKTGKIFCFYNYLDHNSEFNKKAPGKRAVDYRHYVQSSKDHGKTWSKPRDIREEIMPDHVQARDFVFISSGRGIQRENGDLLHTITHVGKGGYLFGSKDGGKTWGAYKEKAIYTPANENKVVELSDGALMINARNNGGKFRYVHRSTDQGASWTGAKDLNLPDPSCNAEPLVYTRKKDGYAKDRLLFVNACSLKGRKNLVLSISYDDGKTWKHRKCLKKGSAAYSSMTICKNGDIGIFYEDNKAKEMIFVRTTLKALTDGEDKLSIPFDLKK